LYSAVYLVSNQKISLGRWNDWK